MAFRVGIVGLGMAVTPHAKSLADLKVEVAYAFSPSAARRAQFAARFPFPQCDRLETILDDRSVNAVLILTPPNTHLELVEKFAAAGKHILLEKPLEISLDRAERLVEACSKVKLGIVLQHRFRPGAEKLREMLPELGRLVSASAAIPNWRPQSYYDMPGRGTKARDGGGVLLTQGIHTLDLFLSLVGEAAEVKSFVTTSPVHKMETEDLVAATVKFKNGAIGTVHATTAAYPGFPERIELIGTKGTALLEGPSLRIELADGKKLEVKAEGGGTGADPMAFPHDWHRDLLADFLAAIENNRQPRISGEEALKVHRFIDRILRSAG
ncbi:MAG TPA: Gfo/Idh/MocA family oxidoreductase [Burkholderiales bacterium]|nr:Gfo/Idh/MocA family oxidoreductase [Burkholderiales bacterium]